LIKTDFLNIDCHVTSYAWTPFCLRKHMVMCIQALKLPIKLPLISIPLLFYA